MRPRDARCQGIAELITSLTPRGVDVSSLCDGLDVTLAEISNPRTWIDWDTAAELHERVENLAGGPGAIDSLVEDAMPRMVARNFANFVANTLPPAYFLRVTVLALAPRAYPVHSASVKSLDSQHLEVTLTLPSDKRGCAAFFRSAAASLRNLPRFCGCDAAQIDAEISPHRARLLVTVPHSPNLWIRLKRAFRNDIRERLLADMIAQREEMANSYRELQRAYEDLEATTLQLREAQKMETVGQLIGGIAHDFNNSLTIVLGCTDLLLDGDLDPDSAALVESIRQAATGSSNLTRQLLAFARRQIMHPRVLNLNDLITRLDAMLHTAVGEEVELEFVAAAGLGQTRVDPGQMEQVIINLVLNAAEAMGWRGKVTMETCNVQVDREYALRHREIEPGRYVMLSVSDTGSGMSQEVQDQVFEPFFTTKEGGTGLGLAMVQGIVAQCGGIVNVYSEPGAGSTFRIYLPRVEQSGEAWEELKPLFQGSGGNECVLVVEDEPALRDLIARTLRRYGYEVVLASDGLQALGMLDSITPDVVLTDVVMPGISGIELAARIRADDANLPVLFMSGYTENAIIHRGELDPDIRLLEKPFSSAGLLQSIRGALDARNPAAT